MPIAPTLILGLGGTGSKIVARVADKVKESASSQENRIAYVVFDTDINELREIREKNPGVFTVQTSTVNTVGDYLTVNTNARDNWFPVNEMLNRKTLTEGAAQVRAISRLAFDTTLKSGKLAPLRDAIDTLFRVDKDNQEQALRVIITSSLAGGTGSGLILSVAMYLSSYLKAKFPHLRAITRGFFLQPDVFYDVIPGADEQQNLKVNAYATIRELDAFLMKGDNTLPPQYRNLKFEFPTIGGEGVEPVNAMPYDFCFLFDAQGTSGSLTSFGDILDHAATCIYTQSIGPMSKRSNSSEDNTLREVIKNNGRNRYAGAGASRLVYPRRHVEKYFAYTWLRTAVSRDWLKFDAAFQGQLAGVRDQQDKGFSVPDLRLEKVFPQTVDTKADGEKDPFARSIKDQAVLKDPEGITEIGKKWAMYLSGLMSYLETRSKNDTDDALKAQLSANIAELSGNAPEYYERYLDLKKYHDLVERHAQENAAITAYSLFGTDSRGANDGQPFALETYLKNQRGDGFIHPVSARYFLYKLLDMLEKQKATVDIELNDLQGYFRDFEKQAFDDPSTDEIEGPESVLARKQGFVSRVTNRQDGWQKDLADKFATYLKKVGDLGNAQVNSAVLTDAIVYVKGLSDAFEKLFDNLRQNLARLGSDIDKLYTAYNDTKGSTTRFVYADSKSLDHIGKSVLYKGGSANADSDLSQAIFAKVREYAAITDEKDENYFQDLYSGTIVQHFVKKFREQQGSTTLDIDVIEALEREYRARTKNVEEANIRHYVVSELNAVKALAAPFIESPLGEDRHPIFACAFNPSIKGDAGSKREALINEHLSNYGGQPDDEIPSQEILFYNAIYGIRARDLSKFSPPRVSQTENLAAGEYFTAYFRLVSQIRPSVDETKVITPHIDRRWHTIAAMPDLDEGNQSNQLTEIHRALLKGLVHGHIIRDKSIGSGMIYRYKPLVGPEQDFIVSNGTPCDQFYEVVDSLTIDPVAVSRLREAVDRRIQATLAETSAVDYLSSPFGTALAHGVELTELRQVVPSFPSVGATIFDIAAFWAISVPKDHFEEEYLAAMTRDFIALIQEEVFRLEDGDQRYTVLEEVLRQQFREFTTHLSAFTEKGGAYFNRKLRVIIGALGDLLIDLPLSELRAEVYAVDKQLLARD
ncbi:tubulin-like doman-containing protein [Naasia aerilata]|uniref:Phosphonate ABC transporter permease n=1 Tax=Naasia aerilata TaxID=1162966 RepID=A0ABN6XQQ0_9MICO|nr:tubulin-like doman-containing protein [Naasia aerilata]BDZ47181.1 phosphonate ABC transporter permease [Naasia aerilata]